MLCAKLKDGMQTAMNRPATHARRCVFTGSIPSSEEDATKDIRPGALGQMAAPRRASPAAHLLQCLVKAGLKKDGLASLRTLFVNSVFGCREGFEPSTFGF